MIITSNTALKKIPSQDNGRFALPSLQSPAPQSRHSRRCVSELPGCSRPQGHMGWSVNKNSEEPWNKFRTREVWQSKTHSAGVTGLSHTAFARRLRKQSNCTCYHFHTSPPVDRTENVATWHCKIHCALSFRTNSPARVCIARIGTSADMTTVMTLLLWHSRYLTNIDHPDFKRFPGFCFTMHTLLGQGSLESFKHPTNYT